MASKGKGSNTVNVVWKIAEPIANELGYELWDVRFEKEGADWFLRVFIDKEDGISINDCVDMTHALDEPLDEADPIDQSYCLEVCSPGLERSLKRDSHFEKSIGKAVQLKTIRPIDGIREFKGVLESYDNGSLELVLEDGTKFVINKKETAYVKLDDFSEEF